MFFLGVLRGKHLAKQSGETAPVAVQAAPAARTTQPQQTPMTQSPQPGIRTTAVPSAAQAPAAPAPAPQRPAIATPLSLSKKPYTIQLVTYKKQDLAQKEVNDLKKAGYSSSLISSGDYFLVCVGQYASIDEAKKDLRYFGSRYKDCFLRRR
jgi:cell division septation protein DedD